MPALESRLGVDRQSIGAFCAKWGVAELALFGSVTRADFGPDSDVDVMVRFSPAAGPRGLALLDMKLELEALFKRPVDLVRYGAVDNPFRLRSIRQDLTVVYAA